MDEHTTINVIFAEMREAESEMTEGDYNFYFSLRESFDKRGLLSASQLFHLERLSKKYDPTALSENRAFKASYDAEKRETARRVALYYDTQFPRYFSNIIDKVLVDPKGHVLNRTEWNKFCENKYAKKIRSVYNTELKFSPGDFVQVRANNRVDLANISKDGRGLKSWGRANATGAIKEKYGMVTKANAKPITRPAKGSRIYQILLTEESQTIFAHESDLKKARRVKK
jgi:hypothetical protein